VVSPVLTLTVCAEALIMFKTKGSFWGSLAGLLVAAGSALGQLPTLTPAEVDIIVRRAIDRANALNVNVTISVVDRQGVTLACVRMINNTRPLPNFSVVGAEMGGFGGLERSNVALTGINVPAIGLYIPTSITAITKAGTAAFLSTRGNAFSTRTAAYIIYPNFPPGVTNQASGPLFGVQLSSLPTSDIMRLPLGLSADSGGLPLYKNNQCVGGIGIETGVPNLATVPVGEIGKYRVDTFRPNGTPSIEETIALAGQAGFSPIPNIWASAILINGIRLPYTFTGPFAAAAPVVTVAGEIGAGRLTVLLPAGGPPFLTGNATSMFASTILPATSGPGNLVLPGATGVIANGESVTAFRNAGTGVIAPIAGAVVNGQLLTAGDVQTILSQAHAQNNALRAMIRRDNPQFCRVNVSVVDVDGNLLGIYRSEDAPIFGFDVCVQKARSVVLFSRQSQTLPTIRTSIGDVLLNSREDLLQAAGYNISNFYLRKYRDAMIGALVPIDGSVAFSNRAIGFIARPRLPDGIPSGIVGPLSAFGPLAGAGSPVNVFSQFNTGIQLDLVLGNLARFLLTFNADSEANSLVAFETRRLDRATTNPLTGTLGNSAPLVGVPSRSTTGEPDVTEAMGGLPGRTVANGLQIFPGAVPLYKSGVLVGGVGVSGDGIEQDDAISQAGSFGFRQFGSVRTSDQLVVRPNVRLPYIKFPRNPGAGIPNIVPGVAP